jgi:hypothetical protein
MPARRQKLLKRFNPAPDMISAAMQAHDRLTETTVNSRLWGEIRPALVNDQSSAPAVARIGQYRTSRNAL